MTRRVFSGAFAGVVMAQKPDKEIASAENDTFLHLIDITNIKHPDLETFSVGVRTKIQAEWALVRVFYHELHPEFGRLMRSKESMAPVAGINGYGGTRENFAIAREMVAWIEIVFLNEVATRKVRF